MLRFSLVLEAILFYGTGARVFNSLDASECSLLCEIGKRFLHTTAEDLVRTSDGKAVLYEYFGDGTPMRIKVFFDPISCITAVKYLTRSSAARHGDICRPT